MRDSIYAYLSILDDIAQIKNDGLMCAYGFNQTRTDLHNQIESCFDYDIVSERLAIMLHHLDILIDFNPPIEKYDSLKVYASKLERWFACQEGIYFLTGKTYKINGANGVLEDDHNQTCVSTR